jgi:hypothetical protein
VGTNLLLEGDDLEAVLIRAHAEGGVNARIVRAEKVRQGGFLGFFARERFEVAVEIPDGVPAPAAEPTIDPRTPAERAFDVRLAAEEAGPVDQIGQNPRQPTDHDPRQPTDQNPRQPTDHDPRQPTDQNPRKPTDHDPGGGQDRGPGPGWQTRDARRAVDSEDTLVAELARALAERSPAPAQLAADGLLGLVDRVSTAEQAASRSLVGAGAPLGASTAGDPAGPGIGLTPGLNPGLNPGGNPSALCPDTPLLILPGGRIMSGTPTSPGTPAVGNSTVLGTTGYGAPGHGAPGHGAPGHGAPGHPGSPGHAGSPGYAGSPGHPGTPGYGTGPDPSVVAAQCPTSNTAGDPAAPSTHPGGAASVPPAPAPGGPSATRGPGGGPVLPARPGPAPGRPPGGPVGPDTAGMPAWTVPHEPPAGPVRPSTTRPEFTALLDQLRAGALLPRPRTAGDLMLGQPGGYPRHGGHTGHGDHSGHSDHAGDGGHSRRPGETADLQARAHHAYGCPGPAEPDHPAGHPMHPAVTAPTAYPTHHPAPGPPTGAEPRHHPTAGTPAPTAEQVTARQRLAGDRRTLRSLGVPQAWTRRMRAGDRFAAVLRMLERMPDVDIDPDVAVVALVGPRDVVQLEAHRTALDLPLEERPRPVVVVPRDRRSRRPAIAKANKLGTVVAAIETDGYECDEAVLEALHALGAGAVIALVDADRPIDESQRWLDALGQVDAIVVDNTAAVGDPASVLQLGLPVVRLDGIPVDRVTWSALLCAQLEAADPAR